jgi:signal transduction histidine kinase/CheY-like chemotaxis protein
MTTYEISSDLADEKKLYLNLIQLITFPIGLVCLAISMLPGANVVAPWLWLLGALALSYVTINYHLKLSTWIYMSGLLGLGALIIWQQGPVSPAYFLMLIPVGLSIILLQDQINLVTGLAIVLMVVTTTLRTDVPTTIGISLAPALAAVVLAAIAHVSHHNHMGLVNWALDSQKKNADRAEVYYQQREQLKQAILDVQHARAKLEIMNVQLEEAQAKAERASSAKSVFLSNMSHELRTPLNVVIGYTSSMLNMPQMYSYVPLPDVYRSDIALINENGQYLLGLINDILDLSKIEAGRLQLHPQVASLPDILNGTIATSIGLLKDKPVQIVPDFSDALPDVWADPMRVRQIILNLMSNAIKFTDTGSVTLSARLEGDQIRIAVTDTGIGIPADALPVIFDRFKQAQQDTDKHYGGTGLGLDISQQLSRMHGGDLTVHSVVGQGSTFSFTLPLATAEQLSSVRHTDPLPMSSMKIFDSVPELDIEMHTVLVVEDDANMRKQLRAKLDEAGYVVIDTHYGDHVIEMAVGLLPTLIVLDVPEGEDARLLNALRADPELNGIPVIVCALGDQLNGATSLMKPFTPEAVIERVQQALVYVS